MQITERLWIFCAVTMILSLSSGGMSYAGNLNDGLAGVSQKAEPATFAENKDSSMTEESDTAGEVSESTGLDPEIGLDGTGNSPERAESYGAVASISASGGGPLSYGRKSEASQQIYQEGDQTLTCVGTCLKSAGVSVYTVIMCGVQCATGNVIICAACLGVGGGLVLLCTSLCLVYAN